ncbi:MAG: T9SS type A sorting domain-containing protein [Bacteroidota bacterium]
MSRSLRFYRLLLLLLVFFGSLASQAQQVLLSEDFNDCAYPSDWSVNLEGNQDVAWQVGYPANSDSDSSTIDGSCMVIIDDDLTGDDTPPFTLQLITPAFDATAYQTVAFSVDVHFRNAENAASFSIKVWDGTAFQQIVKYKGGADHMGEQFSDFVTFEADLSFYANPEMQLLFEYDDGNVWAWWAGFDNVLVVGEGEGENLVLEDFNDCRLPDGWTTNIVTGEDDWQFGHVFNDNNGVDSTMNGSCFVYFDDDGLGEDVPFSTVELRTPFFDGSQHAELYADLDIILRRYKAEEQLSVSVYDAVTNSLEPVVLYLTDLGGPKFDAYVRERIDLTAHRSSQMQLVFTYIDGRDWGWWVGMDNIKVFGQGKINERCELAEDIQLGQNCVPANNRKALFTGPIPDCSDLNYGSLWYRYQADFDGILDVQTNAQFNDVLTFFEGDCANISAIGCVDADEHGFVGERLLVEVENNKTYWLRINGKGGNVFGRTFGDLCLELQKADDFLPRPVNDWCSQAIDIQLEDACVEGINFHAESDGNLPSRNLLSRADVWYAYQAQTTGAVELTTQANFSDVITLYSGDCNYLKELQVNEFGQSMKTEPLEQGQTYYFHISGFFATLEGQLCASLSPLSEEGPDNDLCLGAQSISLGSPCVEAVNTNAGLDGPPPSCEPYPAASVWYKFEAPASGGILLHTNAHFVHTVAVFEGACDQLSELFCANNPSRCEDYLSIGDLVPGDTYHVQIASANQYAVQGNEGRFCLSIRDIGDPSQFEPLKLVVEAECLENGIGRLNIVETSGGVGELSIHAPNLSSDRLVNAGATWLVVLEDENDCVVTQEGTMDCTLDSCGLMLSYEVQQPSCSDQLDGQIFVELLQGEEPTSYEWSDGSSGTLLANVGPGQYVLTVNTSGGCQYRRVFSLEAPTPVQITASNVQAAVDGENGSIELLLGGGDGPFSFAWYDADSILIGTEQNIDGLLAGTYRIVVTDASGCSTEALFVVDQITSTTNLSEDIFVALYPNPTQGRSDLQLRLPEVQQIEVKITDVSGKVVLTLPSVTASAHQWPLELPTLESGVYMVHIHSEKYSFVRSLALVR